jgi:hypothetical protein
MKRTKISVLIIFISLLLVGCQYSAKTEHWKIQVTGTSWVESTSAIEQMWKNAGYPIWRCYSNSEGPFLAIQVTITNISKETLEYPDFWGTFYAFIVDEQGNIYKDVNTGMTTMENNSGTLIPGYSIDDIYVFAVPEYSGKLVMRIRENREGSIEVPISISLPDMP